MQYEPERELICSSGSWTRLSFPHIQKHTSLETFFPSESRAVLPKHIGFQEKCPYKEFHRRLRQQEPHRKKTLQNLHEPGNEILGTNILSYTSKFFFLNFVHA